MEIKQPTNLVEAIRYFANPDACLNFLVPLVWPNGVTCRHCGATDPMFLKTRRIWKCKACRKQFSIKTGTIMEDSPLPLDKWLVATWLIASAKNGISSYEIHRALKVTQKTAWFLLHRIRLALKSGSFTKMDGTIEADEMHYGGKVGNFKNAKKAELRKEAQDKKPGRPVNLSRVVKKTIVMGMLERGLNGKVSQMRTEVIEHHRKHNLHDAIRRNVEPGAQVMTDALPSYKGLDGEYLHRTINHAVSYAHGKLHTNGTENFWALMARMLMGTYVAVEPFHLESYLDEQCFRFNNRRLKDGDRFLKALRGVSGRRLTYADLIGETAGEGLPTSLPTN